MQKQKISNEDRKSFNMNFVIISDKYVCNQNYLPCFKLLIPQHRWSVSIVGYNPFSTIPCILLSLQQRQAMKQQCNIYYFLLPSSYFRTYDLSANLIIRTFLLDAGDLLPVKSITIYRIQQPFCKES